MTLFLVSCAGYRFQTSNQFFSQHGVYTLYVPMFYNKTPFSGVSPVFTREIYSVLRQFPNLKIVGSLEGADAVLIGIIESNRDITKATTTKTLRLAKSVAPTNVGDGRQDFYIPSTSNVTMGLRLIMVKGPSAQMISILQSDIGKQAGVSSKIIFNEVISVTGVYNREYLDEQGGEVVATQNRGAQKNIINNMAAEAATSFENMVIYAF